jgi:peptide deformylase
MFQDLKIINYPDPRLKKRSVEVTAFDDRLRALAARMFELMRAEKGVGLAAPQVGENIRLFVMNATGEPGDDRVYVNPILSDPDGEEEAEEGCLSLPEIRADILRSKSMRIDAQDLEGKPFQEVRDGFVARVWQHETDHLNGTLILDRMGPVAKMAARRFLKDLEEEYAKNQQHKNKPPKKPPL